jgi:transcriptional regulator GlxA family with amidase domain
MSTTIRIGIIVFDGVLTSEVIGPAEVFAIAGESSEVSDTEVLLIGIEQQPTIRTEEGIRLSVDATIADDLALDVLIVPGANSVNALLQHEPLNNFIRKHAETAQWLGSVCAGAFVLGGAGVLDGKHATTWFGGETRFQTQFPSVKVVHNQPVVLDQRRITANGGLVSYRAALILVGQMMGTELAKEVYRSLSMGRLGTWTEIEANIREAQ